MENLIFTSESGEAGDIQVVFKFNIIDSHSEVDQSDASSLKT